MEKRFQSLGILAYIYKIIGVLALVGGLLLVVTAPSRGIGASEIPFTIGALVGALTLYAIGAAIEAYVAIEESTRRSAIHASQMAKSTQEIVEALNATVAALSAMITNTEGLTEKIDAVAESTRTTATLLYRQQTKGASQ